MKIINSLICAFLVVTNYNVYAQSFERVSNSEDLTWFGLDFSNAVMMGDFSGPITYGSGYYVTTTDGLDVSPKIIRDDLYVSWNNLILNEPDKYYLKKFFGNKDFNYLIEPVMTVNSEVDLDKIKVTSIYTYDPFNHEKLQSIVKAYKKYIPEETDGIGVTFIIEKFDKTNKIGITNIVFFDIATCEIIFSDRIISEPGGYGLRNYWAGSVYKTLKTIQKKKWKKWLKDK